MIRDLINRKAWGVDHVDARRFIIDARRNNINAGRFFVDAR